MNQRGTHMKSTEQIKSNKASSTLDQIDRVDQWADDKGLHFRFNDGKTAAKQYRLENEKNTLLCSATSKGEISLRLGELNKVLKAQPLEIQRILLIGQFL